MLKIFSILINTYIFETRNSVFEKQKPVKPGGRYFIPYIGFFI